MEPSLVVEYATEGAPLLVTDVRSAAHWRGREDDGSGVVVEFMGQGVETLPKALLQTAKPGRQIKKFGNLAEAREFEDRVLAALKKLHPEAAKHPRFPNQPAYYVGSARVFSVETKFTSMFDSILKGLKSDVQAVVFDKKNKGQGIFMQQQGGGRGLIVADPKKGRLIIAKLHHGAPDDSARAGEELAGLVPPKSKTKVALDGRLLVFDAAQSQRDVAEVNWRRGTLDEVAGEIFARDGFGALRIRGQQAAGGAFLTTLAGDYAVSYKEDSDAVGGANVLWLTHG